MPSQTRMYSPSGWTYINTVKTNESIDDEKVSAIDREAILGSPERLELVVGYIREHFEQKTKRNTKPYAFNALQNIDKVASAKDRHVAEEIRGKIRLSGFNSIFAVSSIEVAKKYYAEFQRQQKEADELSKLKVAIIYSFGANEDDVEFDGIEDENSESTDGLDSSSRDFLDSAISDYNNMFGTSYDTSTDKFQSYYKDVSLRMKNREIDLLIVVNMFLTGFDATTLNTLWVDKNLKQHGLLQAFSRTNRILNSIKVCGNIVAFRDLEKETNEALALFGNKDAKGVVLLRSFGDYYNGYDDGTKQVKGYEELIAELVQKYPIGERILGEEDQKAFIKLYGSVLKLTNILSVFDEFPGLEILSSRNTQDYHSMYIDLYHSFRSGVESEKVNVNDDVVFEIELIKQVEINIDYILDLVKKYYESNQEDKEILIDINKAIDSSIELRNKKDLIEQFVNSLNIGSEVDDDWEMFISKKKVQELKVIINDEKLNMGLTFDYIESAFRDGIVQSSGTAIAKILPPVSRFSDDGSRTEIRERVIDKLTAFFNRFFDV